MSAKRPTSPAAALRSAAPPRRLGRLPEIDPSRCTGCGWCVAACELHLLSLQTRRWVKVSVLQQPERCTGCNRCALRCPFHAISLKKMASPLA